jgi:predicted nucleic acid-binding protein
VSVLLLDASVILAAFDSDDELHGPSQTLLANPDVTLTTLDLARYEVANVAVRGWCEFGRVAPLLEAIDRISGAGAPTICAQASAVEPTGLNANRFALLSGGRMSLDEGNSR